MFFCYFQFWQIWAYRIYISVLPQTISHVTCINNYIYMPKIIISTAKTSLFLSQILMLKTPINQQLINFYIDLQRSSFYLKPFIPYPQNRQHLRLTWQGWEQGYLYPHERKVFFSEMKYSTCQPGSPHHCPGSCMLQELTEGQDPLAVTALFGKKLYQDR